MKFYIQTETESIVGYMKMAFQGEVGTDTDSGLTCTVLGLCKLRRVQNLKRNEVPRPSPEVLQRLDIKVRTIKSN